ncbi:LysR family transcriptional regulator [Pseudoduganella umbonata]|uniref:DNA-binding transcriptional LysR family regulator n=1 Tax=Pseudoduganella umbonata TaxID=864828 RepID=A0A4P8HMD7_9BURK|nr:LysR family transcriptional regulator [Pseudoduganella umbonata]MBB3219432.1 DNA-binding transcriptional LysR family regulator [Pseudoduganella umbonata]QCP09522.1 LysR family transcriptional regulator [Pseudoduganella umbonata]
MGDQLSGIAAFVRAAEASSFAVAAEAMGLSRSAVGKAIARLEERLGVQLFHRTTRTLRLTDEGAAFYERCAVALADIRDAEAGFDAAKRQPAGRVRVSVPVLLGRHCIAPVLVDLAAANAQLELEVAFTDRPVDLLADGFDLVVRTGALGDEGDLKARRLGTQAMLLCAAPAYLRVHGTPARLEEIGTHALLAYGKGQRVVSWHFNDHGQRHEIKPAGRLRFDDLEAIADAAASGSGLAWLPSWLVAARLRRGQLVEVLPALRGPGFDVHAVWPVGRYLPMRVRAVIDALVREVPARLDPG